MTRAALNALTAQLFITGLAAMIAIAVGAAYVVARLEAHEQSSGLDRHDLRRGPTVEAPPGSAAANRAEPGTSSQALERAAMVARGLHDDDNKSERATPDGRHEPRALAGRSGSANAQESSALIRLHITRAGAVLLARVIANESTRVLRGPRDHGTGGDLDADAYAIAEVVDGWSRWQHTSHLQALRRLAPHVTGAKPALLRRHAVFGALPAFGELRPAAWIDRDGDWRVHGPLWARFRDNVIAMVNAGWVRRCAGPVLAWGNDHDSAIAISRGLVQVACGASTNHYWALPPRRTTDAVLASAVRP